MRRNLKEAKVAKSRSDEQKSHIRLMTPEEQTIADIERELQLEINSWSKVYGCGMGNIAYNAYTKSTKDILVKVANGMNKVSI